MTQKACIREKVTRAGMLVGPRIPGIRCVSSRFWSKPGLSIQIFAYVVALVRARAAPQCRGMEERFTGNFTQQEPISEAGIAAVADILRSGRLHRYNLAGAERGAVAALEEEYAAWQGARHCLAVTSGGQGMQIALRAAGVQPGDPVLTNAFTLAPVPGAIAAIGARPVLVEVDDTLCIDLEDLRRKWEICKASCLLLSHMRGHLCDMDKLVDLASTLGLTVIEDCAHTMGAEWNGVKSGNFGHAACFSTQTYKHMNSGEGGLVTSNDAGFMARAIILSGSYMNHATHGTRPDDPDFADARLDMPNCSARMDMMRAALLRTQLPDLPRNIDRWARRFEAAAAPLAANPAVSLPAMRPEMRRVGSSIQFRVPSLDPGGCDALVQGCAARGVVLKWFGRDVPEGFTSAHPSWRYVDRQDLPQTDRILATLFDMRLPLTFPVEDCDLIGRIIAQEVAKLAPAQGASL